MHKHKHERVILNLLIERTLFIYNIVLSNSFNITKTYKKKCIRLLVEVQKYFRNMKYQRLDTKFVKYQFNQYRILMNKLDRLMKLFDNINGSEKIKQILAYKFSFYISETVNQIFPNPNYEKNYIIDFFNFFTHLSVKSLMTRESNDLIYYNEFCLL